MADVVYRVLLLLNVPFTVPFIVIFDVGTTISTISGGATQSQLTPAKTGPRGLNAELLKWHKQVISSDSLYLSFKAVAITRLSS